MSHKGKADFDAFAEGYSFWKWTTDSPGSRGYADAMSFLPTPTKRVLDAGCGSGVLSLKLSDHADYMVGVDISLSMIRLAKGHQARLKKKNLEFVVADLQNLPFEEGTFDFVVSDYAMHDTRMDLVIPALSRLLKPGGRMVIGDLVTSHPHLDSSPLWQMLLVIRRAPGYALTYGLWNMWRFLSFQLSPAWIQHVVDEENMKLTPESFREIYSRLLPGCRFERNPKAPWRMAVFWEAQKAKN
jgi:SAM-dependent methyltransferase